MSQKYEFDAWIGDTKDKLTEDAYEELYKIWCEADQLFELTPASGDEPREIDYKAMTDYLAGAAGFASAISKPTSETPKAHAATVLQAAGEDWAKARAAYHAARLQLYGAIKAAYAYTNRNQIIVNTGVGRDTVYKVLDAEKLS
ncbi:hypothetical protein [Varibaculum cambriense]|uniref:hypothetical protein n=1 Tax=Varibaculum cambriense TaxID=184870 RepID=UPI00290546B3|nr:hypothetical protein [Varibaculum cambriense]MDU1225073.1 hypothetical protein [Varibaculum cambriense]